VQNIKIENVVAEHIKTNNVLVLVVIAEHSNITNSDQ
jgi:hypothetical protein